MRSKSHSHKEAQRTMTDENPLRAAPTKASSRTELEKRLKGTFARGPSGLVYRLRPMDLTRHSMAGGLPVQLVTAALSEDTGEGLQSLFKDMAKAGSDAKKRKETIDYMDKLVLQQVMEPKLQATDLPDPTNLEDTSSLVPADDYTWLVAVAFRATDLDADGRHIWSVEDLNRWATFRHFHGCGEDCGGCEGIRVRLSSALA
jgi:hypothetical protein